MMNMNAKLALTLKVALLLLIPFGLTIATVVATPTAVHAEEMKGG